MSIETTCLSEFVDHVRSSNLRFTDVYLSKRNATRFADTMNASRFAETGSGLAKALTNYLERSSYLRRFLSNGTMPLSNPEYQVSYGLTMLDEELHQGDLTLQMTEDLFENFCAIENEIFQQLLNEAYRPCQPNITAMVDTLERMVDQMVESGGNPDVLLVTTMVWDQLIDSPIGQSPDQFNFVPSTSVETLCYGNIGTVTIRGREIRIISDCFIEPVFRSLVDGSMYLLAQANQLGVLDLRTVIKSQPIDLFNLGQAGVGWLFYQIQSCMVHPDRIIRWSLRD